MLKKNILSITVAAIIAILSLASSGKMPHLPVLNFHGIDKVVHLIMYFVLMSTIIYENRNSLTGPKILLLAGLIPFFFGLVLELLQSWLTVSRKGSIADLLFDLAGILLAGSIYFLLQRPGRHNIKN